MDAGALSGDLQASLGMVPGVDDEVAETLGQRHEVAFGVDDRLLHPGCALFQQPPKQMGFARARISLHQQAGRQQFLQIESRRGACRRMSHLDRNGHVSTQTLPAETGLTTRSLPVERPWPRLPCSVRSCERHQPDTGRAQCASAAAVDIVRCLALERMATYLAARDPSFESVEAPRGAFSTPSIL